MSDNIEIKGKVETILDIQEFASGFKKQTLVIETDGKFPQKIAVEFAKDKIDLLATLTVGQQVAVSVNIRGNEYNGKYYTSLSGWKVDAGSVPMEDDSQIPF
jgi:hypothetical protein